MWLFQVFVAILALAAVARAQEDKVKGSSAEGMSEIEASVKEEANVAKRGIYGYGHGIGHGFGHGYGHDFGHGFGHGHGYGHGIGHGYGHGIGHGYGHGISHGMSLTEIILEPVELVM